MREGGFTIIEILIVMAIIVIVAAITFPIVTSAKKSAKTTQTLQNLRTLQRGALLYQLDYERTSSGTPEEMGLPSWDGTVHLFTGSKYIAPWYADMKSPFGAAGERDYQTLAIPAIDDRFPITWSDCTKRIGDNCILYFDVYEPGKDSRGVWISGINFASKRLHGIALSGSIVTRNKPGVPFDQSWWAPELVGK